MEKEKREPEKGRTKSRLKLLAGMIPCNLQNLYRSKWMLLAALSIAISALVSPTFIVENPQYLLGDIADRNVKAKHDFLIQDEEATAKKREEAIRQSPIVYDLDERITRNLIDKLEASFKAMRETELAAESESPPVPQSQQSIQSAKDQRPVKSVTDREKVSSFPPSGADQVRGKKKDFEEFLGCSLTGDIFNCLVEQQFSLEVQEKIENLIKTTMGRGIASSKAWGHDEHGVNIMIRKLETGEEILIPPPFPYPDIDEARKMIVMQALEPGRDVRELMLISSVVSALLQPNLTFNLEATEKKREEAYASVKPVFIKIARNEMLVREGQSIGREELLKLRFHLKNLSDKSWLFVFMAIFTFSAVCIGVVAHVTKQSFPYIRMDMHDYLFLSILLIFLLVLSRAGLWVGDSIGDSSEIISTKTFIYAVPLSAAPPQPATSNLCGAGRTLRSQHSTLRQVCSGQRRNSTVPSLAEKRYPLLPRDLPSLSRKVCPPMPETPLRLYCAAMPSAPLRIPCHPQPTQSPQTPYTGSANFAAFRSSPQNRTGGNEIIRLPRSYVARIRTPSVLPQVLDPLFYRPCLHCANHHRIQVHVTRQSKQVVVSVHKFRLKAAVKKMASRLRLRWPKNRLCKQ